MARSHQVVLAAVLSLAFAAPLHAQVQISMHDGHVTLIARDATVRQILAEWSRVGQTRIVNAERVSGGPISIELTNVPEKQALDIVLRSVSGYLAAPRAVAAANVSHFDRIYVMPGTPRPRSTASSTLPPPLPQPRIQPIQSDPDEAAPVFNPAQRPPLVGTPPPAPPLVPPAGPTAVPSAPPPSTTPAVPAGTRAPGMIVQPPTPPPTSPGVAPARF